MYFKYLYSKLYMIFACFFFNQYIIAVLLMTGASLAAKLGDSTTPVAIVSQLTDLRTDGSYDFR